MARLLKNIDKCNIESIYGLIIVDSSDNAISPLIFRNILEKINKKVIIYSNRKNLAYQRNKALHFLQEQKALLVHFLDDDVMISSEYFETKSLIFNEYASKSKIISILGGIEYNLFDKDINKKMGLCNRIKSGKVTKSGINHKIVSLDKVKKVDWISGMMLTINAPLLKSIYFRENLLGNSVGEDVIYCLEANQLGAVIADPRIRVYHYHDNSNRESSYLNRDSFNFYRFEACKSDLNVNKYFLSFSLLYSTLKYLSFFTFTRKDIYSHYVKVDFSWAKRVINYIFRKNLTPKLR